MTLEERLIDAECMFIRETFPCCMKIEEYNEFMSKFVRLQLDYLKHMESIYEEVTHAERYQRSSTETGTKQNT